MTTIDMRQFEMGRVPSRTFEVFSRNAGLFLGLAFVLSGLPAALQQIFLAPTAVGVQAVAGGALINAALGIVKLVLTFVLQGALVSGAIADMNGAKPDVSLMLDRGRQVMLPLIGLAILQTMAISLGFLLLIVPGLFLLTIWIVAVPSLVVEGTGVFGAFSRSSALTLGHRWAVFGLILIYLVLAWILMAIGGVVVALTGGLTGGGMHLPLTIFMTLIATVLGAVSAAAISALYYELRLAKDGVAPEAVFATFA